MELIAEGSQPAAQFWPPLLFLDSFLMHPILVIEYHDFFINLRPPKIAILYYRHGYITGKERKSTKIVCQIHSTQVEHSSRSLNFIFLTILSSSLADMDSGFFFFFNQM